MTYYWRRIGAYIIDLSIISMLIRIVLPIINPIIMPTLNNILIDFFKLFITLFVITLVATMYNVLCYKYFKFPLGKLLLGVQVLDENQQRIPVKKYFIREFNKFVFVYGTLGLYLPYQFIFNVIKRQQTFHDKQANTHIFM